MNMLTCLLFAFAHAADSAPLPSNDDPLLAALRLREPVPCESLPADTALPSDLAAAPPTDLAAKLHAIAESDAAPSWVPMRAAGCLAQQYSADPRFLGWVSPWFGDAALGGLGVAVLDAPHVEPAARLALEPLARAASGRWTAIYARHLGAHPAN